MTRFLATLSLAFLLALQLPLITPAGAQETPEIQEMTLGEPDAPVTVVEYASFTCPHCRTFHSEVFDELKANYIDTGKVRFIYREVYFDRYGLWAGLLARCGGEERYFALADLIYEEQSDWIQDDAAATAEALRRIGRKTGFEDEQVEACLQDADKAQALVALYQQNAEADGIRSTPSFVIDGRLYSNMSYDEFAELLDEKLGE
jgi:protein-disulfide isomerase